MEIQIESGKYYKTKNEKVFGPMRLLDRSLTDYPWTCYDDDPDGISSIPHSRWDDHGLHVTNKTDMKIISLSPLRPEKPSPIRTVTRRELMSGHYGFIEVDNVNEDGVSIWFSRNKRYQADELREAAHILNQIAEYLEGEK